MLTYIDKRLLRVSETVLRLKPAVFVNRTRKGNGSF